MTNPAPAPPFTWSSGRAAGTPPPTPPVPGMFVRKFIPVFVRNRHDGWTIDKQRRFIMALAESGCVVDACRAVGMSSDSAYKLRTRHDALDFRQAWETALDNAVHRLGDAALGRAIHGVPVPHYYKGEVVGEHRRYDERLTQFILRCRDPLTYSPVWDKQPPTGHPEVRAERLLVAMQALLDGYQQNQCEKETAERQAAADVASLAERDRQLAETAQIAEDERIRLGDIERQRLYDEFIAQEEIDKAAYRAAAKAAYESRNSVASDHDDGGAALLGAGLAADAGSSADAGVAAGDHAPASRGAAAGRDRRRSGPAVKRGDSGRVDRGIGNRRHADRQPGGDAPVDASADDTPGGVRSGPASATASTTAADPAPVRLPTNSPSFRSDVAPTSPSSASPWNDGLVLDGAAGGAAGGEDAGADTRKGEP